MNNFSIICGLDEAGRGSWAGPLVAAAVILHLPFETVKKATSSPIKDSKKLSTSQKQNIYHTLLDLKIYHSVEIISTRSINNHGIGWANKEIFCRLIRKIKANKYVVDGNLKLPRIKGKTKSINSVPHADATVPEVILAGIVAKVTRDRIMHDLHKQYPIYHWHKNFGYGTRSHWESLKKHGPTRFHRYIYLRTAERHHGNDLLMQ